MLSGAAHQATNPGFEINPIPWAKSVSDLRTDKLS